MADKPKHTVRRMAIEPADNGGFISRTDRHPPPRKKTDPYTESPEEKCVHGDVGALCDHVRKTFGGKAKADKPGKTSAPPPEWKSVAKEMEKD